jgi:hypothetical protein
MLFTHGKLLRTVWLVEISNMVGGIIQSAYEQYNLLIVLFDTEHICVCP